MDTYEQLDNWLTILSVKAVNYKLLLKRMIRDGYLPASFDPDTEAARQAAIGAIRSFLSSRNWKSPEIKSRQNARELESRLEVSSRKSETPPSMPTGPGEPPRVTTPVSRVDLVKWRLEILKGGPQSANYITTMLKRGWVSQMWARDPESPAARAVCLAILDLMINNADLIEQAAPSKAYIFQDDGSGKWRYR